MEQQQPKIQEIRENITPSYSSQVDPSLVMFQLSNVDVLERVKFSLLGYELVEDEKTGKIVAQKRGERVLSDKGINIISFTLNGLSHKGIFLSNLEQEDAHKITLSASLAINDVLYQKEKEIELDPSYKEQIINVVDANVYTSLRRPVNQGERAFLSRTTERKEIVTQKEQQRPTGIRRALAWLS